MDFPTFLLRSQYITREEFSQIALGVLKATDGKWQNGFLQPSLASVQPDEFDRVRPFPFGDVLENTTDVLQNVLGRAGLATLDDVVGYWQQWHVDFIQPLSDYALSPSTPRPFGKLLYDQGREKRNCGMEFARAIIHDRDHVVIPEGTSSFWVGLAVLALRQDVRIITSNGALVRELLENPKLRQRANSVNVIGGELDVEIGGTGRGFVGQDTQTAYEHAVTNEPGATVVVSSVSGLLPECGPYAPCPVTSFTRHALLRQALDSGVRCVGFVADHTKLRDRALSSYGEPIFVDRDGWQSVLARRLNRIAFVVAPTEEFLRSDEAAVRPKDRTIRGNGFTQPTVDYLQSAARFDQLWPNGEGRFYEAGLFAYSA